MILEPRHTHTRISSDSEYRACLYREKEKLALVRKEMHIKYIIISLSYVEIV